MKVYLFALLSCCAFSVGSQRNDSYPKLTLELGAGFEYANLMSFNQKYVQPVGYGKFQNELHNGWSVNLRTPLQFSSAFEIAMSVNFREFRVKDELELEYTEAEPYYTKTNRSKAANFEGGLQSAIYIDQFWKSRKEAVLNLGVFGSGAFVYSRVRTYEYKRGDGFWAAFTGERIQHWNTSFGLAIKYRFEDAYLNSVVLNTGFNFSTAGAQHDLDLNGCFARVLIGLGR
jgi:hypothetical protein